MWEIDTPTANGRPGRGETETGKIEETQSGEIAAVLLLYCYPITTPLLPCYYCTTTTTTTTTPATTATTTTTTTTTTTGSPGPQTTKDDQRDPPPPVPNADSGCSGGGRGGVGLGFRVEGLGFGGGDINPETTSIP